ncbi:MAG: hypothetical protein LBJ95_00320 [Oscillospiraceae bacterium]|nr:hypothetical protein [Oscillospiraceae bacterium]
MFQKRLQTRDQIIINVTGESYCAQCYEFLLCCESEAPVKSAWRVIINVRQMHKLPSSVVALMPLPAVDFAPPLRNICLDIS